MKNTIINIFLIGIVGALLFIAGKQIQRSHQCVNACFAKGYPDSACSMYGCYCKNVIKGEKIW